MNFKKINTLTGWLVFAIATIVYLMTIERTTSFWDCGEFLVTAYKLEVAHSPGAPLYMLMGRMFGMLSSSPEVAAAFINAMSAFASSFTVLFLFWTITHFARKIITKEETDHLSNNNIISIIGAGVVGALAYAFSDTFWFSAVEAEVYATSSFFTAVTFWAILKWEHVALKDRYADKWLILIFFLIGLSIGVHLLNLLTIPSIILIYYLRKTEKPTLAGGIIAFIIGGVILGIVQIGVIQGLSILASKFEILFTNSFGMPFNSGTIFFMILLAAIIVFVIRYAKQKGKYTMYLATFCFAFTLLGFAAPYAATIIRSKADVPIDMVNPDNVVSLIPYLQREQYGSQPLLSGSNYNANVIKEKDNLKPIYDAITVDGKDVYDKVGEKLEYEFDGKTFFPRMWDRNKANLYETVLGKNKGEAPTTGDNYSYFFNYQFNWMYWRYFMWNYVGRQNHFQGYDIQPKLGNWISGIKPIDKMMGKGDIDLASEPFKNSRARNEYYFLPFILGIIGLIYHYNRKKDDAAVVLSLFIMTGLAIVVYLNNSPYQPRERDYAYVSTYAFAIWIGIGVMQLSDWLGKFSKNMAPAIATTIAVLAVPALMLSKNYDDHDRAPKTLAREHAKNMLMSCDSNAILIVGGDNDTYPIWYLQEIEGVRRDVRVINENLMNTDWQIEQLFYKVNDADAVPFIFNVDQIRGSRLDGVYIYEEPRFKGMKLNAEDAVKFVADKKNDKMLMRGKEAVAYIPSTRLTIPVDQNTLMASGLLDGVDSFEFVPELEIQFNQQFIYRYNLTLISMISAIAKEGWKRPVYFAKGVSASGFEAYLQNQGLLTKLVPVKHKMSHLQGLTLFSGMDKNMDLAINKFDLGNANTDKPFYDDKAQVTLQQYRVFAYELATYLSANNRNEDAIKVLDAMMARMSESSYPYIVTMQDRSILAIIDGYYRAGDIQKASDLAKKVIHHIERDSDYYMSLSERNRQGFMQQDQINLLQVIQTIHRIAMNAKDEVNMKYYEEVFNNLVNKTGLQFAFNQRR